jgi:hypothetical protein
VGALPDKVPSIIMFGLGVGYQLEKLLDEHTVEKLFICEPNPDFFYASLFAIDWQVIFETVEKSETRIYLNIGDDGTNLFRDLLSQFYAIGPYILNSTYFYQSYYNASLNSAISQLREQLQIVISMGEYFDHAYYGIAHTKEGMRRKIPVLAANPSSKLNYDDKEVPIFIVGNGPSLDSSIDAIKEWQGQAIVVSCGTALQALHRHGITPDFHAEIEQNRSTFDWAVLIGDLDYLKNITLISCNGIHPDTCDLYKDVMIAFKEGESSTVSALNVLGRENFTTLLNAFPTVSNFAIDLFSTIGFTSIYLIGVDLGFVDVKHHHSKSSGYYQENGDETYDYSDSANTSLIVPGNFRPKVNTKHEFKVSKQVIEQVISAKPKRQEFYNCSDGAKIQGSLPIRPDELLIVVTESQKAHVIEKLNTSIFSIKNIGNFVENFEKMFSQELLTEELGAFKTLLEKDVICKEDLELVIDKQKEMLFESYKKGKSLLFYYLYGTVNYANAIFTKLICTARNNSIYTTILPISVWAETLNTLKTFIQVNTSFESSGFKIWKREQLLLNQNTKHRSLLAISSDNALKNAITWNINNQFSYIKDISIFGDTKNCKDTKKYDFSIYYGSNEADIRMGAINTLLITHSNDVTEIKNKNFSYLSIPNIQNTSFINNLVSNAFMAIHSCISTKIPAFIIPKILSCDGTLFDDQVCYAIPEGYTAYDFQTFLSVYPDENIELESATSGTKARIIIGDVKMKHLQLNVISKEKLNIFQKLHETVEKNSDVFINKKW